MLTRPPFPLGVTNTSVRSRRRSASSTRRASGPGWRTPGSAASPSLGRAIPLHQRLEFTHRQTFFHGLSRKPPHLFSVLELEEGPRMTRGQLTSVDQFLHVVRELEKAQRIG